MIDPYKGVPELVKIRTSEAAFHEFQEGIVEVLEEHMRKLEIPTWTKFAESAKMKMDGATLRASVLGDPRLPISFLYTLFEAVGQTPRILASPRNDIASS